MAALELLVVDSVEALRAHAEAWDQLWRRSRVALPTARAEPLAIWLESFAARRPFRALVAREGERFLASLPLVEQKFARTLNVGGLPNNDYALCGDLAIDPQCDRQAVIDLLIAGIKQLRWSMLSLDGIAIEAPDWRSFHHALREQGLRADFHHVWDVGVVDVPHDWQAYLGTRSRNQRRQIKRHADRIKEAGGAELDIVSRFAPDEIEALLRRGFETESHGWKGLQGTAVIQQPEIFEFYCRQAGALAALDHLELVFLQHRGRTIAFEYQLRAKGISFVPKVGYDEEFAALTPGQHLRALLYEEYQHDPTRIAVDYHGRLVDATAKWSTRSYPVGRLLVAVRGIVGRAACRGYALARPAYLNLKRRFKHEPGAGSEPRPLRETPETVRGVTPKSAPIKASAE